MARTDFRHRSGVGDGLQESTDGQFWRQPAFEFARQAPARRDEGRGQRCEFGSWVPHLQFECCNRLVVAEYGHRNGTCSALKFVNRYGHPHPANRGQVMPESIRCGDGVSGELRETLRDEPVCDACRRECQQHLSDGSGVSRETRARIEPCRCGEVAFRCNSPRFRKERRVAPRGVTAERDRPAHMDRVRPEWAPATRRCRAHEAEARHGSGRIRRARADPWQPTRRPRRCAVETGKPVNRAISVNECTLQSVNARRTEATLRVTD